MSCSLPDSGEEDSPVETAEGSPSGGVMNEIMLLVDVEDPDAPDWNEALKSADRNNGWKEQKQSLTACTRWVSTSLSHTLKSQLTAVSCTESLSAD